MKQVFIVVIFIVSHFCVLNAQFTEPANISQLNKGDKLFAKGKYLEAEQNYQTLFDSIGGNDIVGKRLGVVKAINKKYADAIYYLAPIVEKEDTVDYFVNYHLAKSYHMAGEFQSAIRFFETCLTDTNDFGKISRKSIAQCNTALKLVEGQDADILVTRLDTTVNTGFHELAPRMMFDSILFISSSRDQNMNWAKQFILGGNNMYYSISTNTGYTSSTKIRQLSKSEQEVLSEDYTVLHGLGMKRGTKLYIHNKTAEIVSASYKGNNGTVDEQFELGDASETSYVILDGGKKAYFIRSDLENGEKNKNIYSTVKDSSGTWKVISRLPLPFNSEYNEDCLFWDEDERKLYFSSNRNESIGGYDIFVCQMDEAGQLQQLKNLGMPVNTPGDDVYFFRKGLDAWYSSDYMQESQDVFHVKFKYVPPPPPKPKQPWYIEYANIEGVDRFDDYVVLQNFYFEIGKSIVDTNSKSYKLLLNTLLNTEGADLMLTGYTDWSGNKLLNQRVSFLRASNLFYQLRNDGVEAEKIRIDFLGAKDYRTLTEFENKEDRKNARKLNRCITIRPIEQGSTFILIEESKEDLTYLKPQNKPKYAVMLNISSNGSCFVSDGLQIEKKYVDKEKVYLFFTKPVTDIDAVVKQYNKIKDKYKGAYLFSLED